MGIATEFMLLWLLVAVTALAATKLTIWLVRWDYKRTRAKQALQGLRGGSARRDWVNR